MEAKPRRALELLLAATALGLTGTAADAGLFYAAVHLSGGPDAAFGMTVFFAAALGAVATVLSTGACLVAGAIELAARDVPLSQQSPHH